MIDKPSSHGLLSHRAPRLRAIAELVESRAESSIDPPAAREIARRMRLRASELETGEAEAFEEHSREIQSLAFDAA